MSQTLYELTNDFQMLLDMAESGDIDDDTFKDTMEGLDYEIEAKADGYAAVIKELEADVNKFDTEVKRLSAIKTAISNRIANMKKNLEQSMIATGKKKFKTGTFSFNIQKNQAALVIDNMDEIPDTYFIPQEPKLDRAALKKDLKETDLDMPFAHLEQTESLRIR